MLGHDLLVTVASNHREFSNIQSHLYIRTKHTQCPSVHLSYLDILQSLWFSWEVEFSSPAADSSPPGHLDLCSTELKPGCVTMLDVSASRCGIARIHTNIHSGVPLLDVCLGGFGNMWWESWWCCIWKQVTGVATVIWCMRIFMSFMLSKWTAMKFDYFIWFPSGICLVRFR
jgi:hypothetical protein